MATRRRKASVGSGKARTPRDPEALEPLINELAARILAVDGFAHDTSQIPAMFQQHAKLRLEWAVSPRPGAGAPWPIPEDRPPGWFESGFRYFEEQGEAKPADKGIKGAPALRSYLAVEGRSAAAQLRSADRLCSLVEAQTDPAVPGAIAFTFETMRQLYGWEGLLSEGSSALHGSGGGTARRRTKLQLTPDEIRRAHRELMEGRRLSSTAAARELSKKLGGKPSARQIQRYARKPPEPQ